MLKTFINIILLLFSATVCWFSYNHLTGLFQQGGFFCAGLALGCFLMNLKLNVKDSKINSYKRELEKESISSTENDARVKVLESKIEVLEKALENALNKK